MQVVLYEDGHRSFGPLTALRPVFALRCGALRLDQKIEARRPGWSVRLPPRPGLRAGVAEQMPGRGVETLTGGPTVLLAGGVLPDPALLDALEALSGESVLLADGVAVGARIEKNVARRIDAVRNGGIAALALDPTTDVPARVARRPWDLVTHARAEIEADGVASGKLGEIRGSVYPGAHLAEPGRIAIGEGSGIGSGAVIDATDGPVIIGDGVTVMANAVVVGPCAIGDRSVVKAGARIYPGTCLGDACKVGGEIEGTVFQSYSNKQHDGFLGHSVVGSWVNIGAGTDNSDLKNNYDTVRVEIDGETIDTGLTHFGATIGDHVKTAIGTRLTTGAVIGIVSSVLSVGHAPRTVPPFSWGTPGGFVPYDLDKALDTARRVMARRNQRLTAAAEALLRKVHEAEGARGRT